MAKVPSISVQELAALKKAKHKIDLVDVRTPAEYQEIHASIARNVPLHTLDPRSLMAEREEMADQPLYVICRSGSRSSTACKQFIDAGYTNVWSIEGGTTAWDTAGLPVVRGKQTISLERQVRITAGSLVLLGTLLSFWSIWFALLPAFVGSGLMFAGITDTCGMAIILARMPWNQTC